MKEELQDLWVWARTVGFGQIRPWSTDFLNRFPQVPNFKGLPDAEKAAFTNLLYYRANYLAVLMGLFVVGLLWNALLLLAAAVSAAAVLVIMKLPVRALPPAAQRYAMHVRSTQQRAAVGGGAALLIMGLTGTLTTLLWILLIGMTLILAHALLRPVKRTAQIAEMMAQLQVDWAPSKGGTPDASSMGEEDMLEGGLRVPGSQHAAHGLPGTRHDMVASSTPTALREFVGSSQAAPIDEASLPRPGSGMVDVPLGAHRRGGKVD